MRRIALAALVVFACDLAESPDDAEVSDAGPVPDAAVAEPADAAFDGSCRQIHFGARPTEGGSVGTFVFLPEHLIRNENDLALDSRATLDFLFGNDFSTRWRGVIGDRWFGACGPMNGRFRLNSISGENEMISAVLAGENEIDFNFAAPGTAQIILSGVYLAPESPDDPCADTLPPGTEIPWTERLHVRVVRPAGISWLRPVECLDGGPVLLAEGARVDGLRPQALDADGTPLYPSNTDDGFDVAWSATLCAEAPFEWPAQPVDALPGLTLPAVAGRLSLSADVGAPLAAEVVGPDRVTQVEVSFALAGFGGGPVVLHDGDELGQEGWGRVARRVFPAADGARIGADPLCSAPAPLWFNFEAGPPEICDVRPSAAPEGAYEAPQPNLGVSAYLVSDGTCRLAVSAPGLNAGAGFEANVSATFHRVEALHDAP